MSIPLACLGVCLLLVWKHLTAWDEKNAGEMQGCPRALGGVSEIIDGWLEERQKLISNFVALPSQSVSFGFSEQVTSFCDLMMDYLSSGHFEVYEQLLREGSEFNDGSLEEGQKLFPLIQPTTDAALDFNDDYANFSDPSVQDIRTFAERLSRLGETLEERFMLEDKMIEVLHHAHRDEVMAQE